MFDCGHISIWIACFYSRNEGYIIFILNIRSWRHVVLLGAVFCCLNLQLLQFTGHCRETSFPQESPPNPKYFVSETYFWVIQAREYFIMFSFLVLFIFRFPSRSDVSNPGPACWMQNPTAKTTSSVPRWNVSVSYSGIPQNSVPPGFRLIHA